MFTKNPELEAAVLNAITEADDQTPEFHRRLTRLIENATTSNLQDADVREVIQLATVTLDMDE